MVITGPECSGKTTLARRLALDMQGVYVPEVARPLLMLTSGLYQAGDLPVIAAYQQALEQTAEGCDRSWIICDTSMLVLKIWSAHRFGRVDPFIDDHFHHSSAQCWLLCRPLAEWHPDQLRDNEHERYLLFDLYHKALLEAGKRFLVVPDLPLEERVNWVISELRIQNFE